MGDTSDISYGILRGAGHNAPVLHADLGLRAPWAPRVTQ